MSQERRQYQRIPLEATLSFQELSFHKGDTPATTSYKDVSGGGLLVDSARAYPLGTLLKLELKVPGWGRYQNHFGPVHDAEVRPLVALGMVVLTWGIGGGTAGLESCKKGCRPRLD